MGAQDHIHLVPGDITSAPGEACRGLHPLDTQDTATQSRGEQTCSRTHSLSMDRRARTSTLAPQLQNFHPWASHVPLKPGLEQLP
jgi:hypothetical protein